jgi:hypothetical protein
MMWISVEDHREGTGRNGGVTTGALARLGRAAWGWMGGIGQSKRSQIPNSGLRDYKTREMVMRRRSEMKMGWALL